MHAPRPRAWLAAAALAVSMVAVSVVAVPVVAAPAPAQAGPRPQPVARGADLVAGPQLAGGLVVWGERRGDGGLAVRGGAPGRRPADLFRFAAPADRRTTLALDGLATSGTHLAMVRTASAPLARGAETFAPEVSRPRASSTTLVAGPLGGPFARISGSRGAAGAGGCRPAVVPREPALSGSLLVFVEEETTCARRRPRTFTRIVAVDLARPAAGRRVVAGGSPVRPGAEPRRGVGSPRVAGRFVAWQLTRSALVDGQVVARVLDLRTGRLVQAVDRVRGGARGDILEWFAVGGDGSLALSFQPDGAGHRLAVRTPAGRTRLLPGLLPSGSGGYEPNTVAVTIAGGRTAYVRADGAFVLRGLRGTRTLTRFTSARPLVGDPAFDGRFAAWAVRRGERTTIYRAAARPAG